MKRSPKNPFFRKCDFLEMVGLEAERNNYKIFRNLLKEEIALQTNYDRKHTFTDIEKDLIIGCFKKVS